MHAARAHALPQTCSAAAHDVIKAHAWDRCDPIGVQDIGVPDVPILDMRNCALCHSTLARLLPLELHTEHGAFGIEIVRWRLLAPVRGVMWARRDDARMVAILHRCPKAGRLHLWQLSLWCAGSPSYDVTDADAETAIRDGLSRAAEWRVVEVAI